ncbi:hypothetical protein Salat_2437400 [Sesamum alatum]|uniref:Uncharacterized protein n=1 Tax=Sesamum alatum TaxID=300844 RepID=A0AAE2CFH7_9LAMI|nr:hypothetical protein Salat_2437400 [Sesamum alatum]
MVRCMLKGKIFETSFQEEVEEGETKPESSSGTKLESEFEQGGGVKCMMNGVIYYPGTENVLEAEARRELAAAVRATKIIESHFDDLGRPRLKIVYVADIDDWDEPGKRCSEYIKTIVKAEKEKEKREGHPRPRLIFVAQDPDFWPGSEKDPDVMVRRAKKSRVASHKDFVVPLSPEEENYKRSYYFHDPKAREAQRMELERLAFMRCHDPSLPGTKFLLDNYSPEERDSVLDKYKQDPDLWKEWVRVSQLETTQTQQ